MYTKIRTPRPPVMLLLVVGLLVPGLDRLCARASPWRDTSGQGSSRATTCGVPDSDLHASPLGHPLGRALPHVPEAELYRRFKLVVGVMTSIQADTDRTGAYAEDLSDVDEMVRRLVTFLAAGLRAPVPATRRAG